MDGYLRLECFHRLFVNLAFGSRSLSQLSYRYHLTVIHFPITACPEVFLLFLCRTICQWLHFLFIEK